MRILKFLFRTFLYILTVSFIVAIAVSIKIVSTLIAEQFIYKIIIIGDLCSTLEVVELVNVLVFALLGMGFGLATILLPKIARQQISVVFLIFLVPLIFCVSAFVKYHLWVEEFAETEKTTYAQAESLTNSFLIRRVHQNGFLGYYLYRGEFPVLPKSQREINQLGEIERKVKANFLILHQMTGIKKDVITGVLSSSNWTIRFFYFSLAVLATVTHFRSGAQKIAKRIKIKPASPRFPPVPPRFNTPVNTRTNAPVKPRAKPRTNRPMQGKPRKLTSR